MDPISILTGIVIGIVIGIAVSAVLGAKVLRKMSLTLKQLGIEFGIEADDEKPGVQVGNVGGDLSGDIAGRDVNKNTIHSRGNFFDKLEQTVNAQSKGRVLIRREHRKIEVSPDLVARFPRTRFQGTSSDQELMDTDLFREALEPHIKELERGRWKVSSIRWSDNGSENTFYVEIMLEAPLLPA
jgi:hypothetical protein